MTEVTSNIVVLFSIMIISYLAKQAKLIPKNTAQVLTPLLINITLPALIFSSITSGPNLEILVESLPLIGISFGYYIVASLAASLYFKKLPQKSKRAGVFAYATIFSNTAFIGLPLCSLIFGEPGVVLGSLYDFVQTIFMYTVGIAFMSGQEKGLVKTLRDQLKEPPVIGLLAGLLTLFLGLKIPGIILEPIKMLGSINAVLAMFAVGQYFQLHCFKEFDRLKKLVPLVALKLLIIPLLVLGIAGFLPLTPQSKGVLAIMIASPTGILTAVFAEKYKQDYEFAVMAVVAATGLSIITLPVMLSLLHF
ncbi:MAG: AEC family transporter [Zhaonellaceae bacterium]|jgi:predicted permease